MRQVAGWAKARQGGRWQTVGRVPPGKMAGGRGGVGVRGGVGGPLGRGVGTQLTDGWYSIRRFSPKGLKLEVGARRAPKLLVSK